MWTKIEGCELKRCPFCGTEGEMLAEDYTEQWPGGEVVEHTDYRVVCPNDECRIGPETRVADNSEDAAEDWNRRTGVQAASIG